MTSGRQLSEFGAFTNTINGAGKVTAVPERGLTPGTLAAVGIGLLLYKQRRGSITENSTF